LGPRLYFTFTGLAKKYQNVPCAEFHQVQQSQILGEALLFLGAFEHHIALALVVMLEVNERIGWVRSSSIADRTTAVVDTSHRAVPVTERIQAEDPSTMCA
jgi:hypothetical protein